MNVGDPVYIHYVDADGIGGCGDIICEGTVVRGLMDGTIKVRYRDENADWREKEREFYPHDLRPNDDAIENWRIGV